MKDGLREFCVAEEAAQKFFKKLGLMEFEMKRIENGLINPIFLVSSGEKEIILRLGGYFSDFHKAVNQNISMTHSRKMKLRP